jgi:DNA-binding MarR family transcriptional regulator
MKSVQLSITAGTRRLRLTRRDVGDIERLLHLLGDASGESGGKLRGQAALQALALRIQSARGLRGKYLPPAMFGEAAWDILLSLYTLGDGVAGLDMICESLSIRMNSALRWIDYLEGEGLAVREDWARGPVVKLTEHGREALESYLGRLFVVDS